MNGHLTLHQYHLQTGLQKRTGKTGDATTLSLCETCRSDIYSLFPRQQCWLTMWPRWSFTNPIRYRDN